MKWIARISLPVLLLPCMIRAAAQKHDTVWVNHYEAGFIQFELTLLNRSFFTLTDFHDTIRGTVVIEKDTIRFICDTFQLSKRQRNILRGMEANIKLVPHPDAGLPLLQLGSHQKKYFRIDTLHKRRDLPGTYYTSNGFTGCTLHLLPNGHFQIIPFSDMAEEEMEQGRWTADSQGIRLKGNIYIDKWFTDNQRFYRIPFHLVGKRIQEAGGICTITLSYFAKENITQAE